MKQLLRLTITLCAAAVLALTAFGGPEPLPSGKEMKEVAPAPAPECEWCGFYIGLHAGGQFGHSETNDVDKYYFLAHHHFGYDESGFVGGGQFGYNFQFGRIVLGPEFDLGYMNLDGDGDEPQPAPRPGVGTGRTDSDFYTTLRGRFGVEVDWHGDWLLYVTGGAIGVNYRTGFKAVEQNLCGIDASRTDFNWGGTVGGGIERRLNRHWSIKAEYLYFSLADQSFSGKELNDNMETVLDRYRFEGETMGHIIRGGLNFHF
jgi:outer membrane immunogenic protein